MTTQTISTPKGEFTLKPPPDELVHRIQSLLPFGLYVLDEVQEDTKYGLVMQCGDQEVLAVKQQPPPCDEETGMSVFQANNILIAYSFARYLEHGFAGLFYPCTYIWERAQGQVESGIAYFGGPAQEDGARPTNPIAEAYDNPMGPGFTVMMMGFIRALQKSAVETEITLSPTIGLDIRPRLQLVQLAWGWMAVGGDLVCLKRGISERDPTWTILQPTDQQCGTASLAVAW